MTSKYVGKYALIFFGIMFLINGLIIIRHKKYGPEEGLWGPTFKGKFATLMAVIFVLLGSSLIIVSFAIQ